MIKLKPKGIKYLKLFHLLAVMIWVGAAVIMAVMSWIEPAILKNDMYSLYLSLDVIDTYAIIPAAVLTLTTGLAYSLFTNFGFFKYKWVLVKWIIMSGQILCGSFFLHPLVKQNINIAGTRVFSLNNYIFLYNHLLLHIGGSIQLIFLLYLCYISIMKPWVKSKDIICEYSL